MEMPKVRTEVRNKEAGVTYVIVAYRTITPSEARMAIAAYLKQAGKRRPKPGTVITVQTIIGHDA